MKYSPDSCLEGKVSTFLQRKGYILGETLFPHPYISADIGIIVPDTDLARMTANAKKQLTKQYPPYVAAIERLEVKRFSAWKGDYMVVYKGHRIHIDVQDEFTHSINDMDDSKEAVASKLAHLFRDLVKEQMFKMAGIHNLVVDESTYQNVCRRLGHLKF